MTAAAATTGVKPVNRALYMTRYALRPAAAAAVYEFHLQRSGSGLVAGQVATQRPPAAGSIRELSHCDLVVTSAVAHPGVSITV